MAADRDGFRGVLFDSEQLEVNISPADATAVRPEYNATAGYSGAQVSMSLTTRFPRCWVGGILRYENLSGAVFEDSPLVNRDSALSVGVALSRVFGESSSGSRPMNKSSQSACTDG